MAEPYPDRREAGQELSKYLAPYANRKDVLVLGLPRGGVPVAYEVARALGAPLDVIVVRKLGVPGFEELAMGAIASGGVRILNQDVIAELRLPQATIDQVTTREAEELERRERLYRGEAPPPEIEGKIVIVVDDGLATGSSMRAAVAALRAQAPQRVVVAVPVGAAETCRSLQEVADEVICPLVPSPFDAVGRWYTDFTPTSDEEVRALLDDARAGFRESPDTSGADHADSSA